MNATRSILLATLCLLIVACDSPTTSSPPVLDASTAPNADASTAPKVDASTALQADASAPNADTSTPPDAAVAETPPGPKTTTTELLEDRPRSRAELPTTSCSIHRGNLNGTIRVLTGMAKADKAGPVQVRQLITSIYSRAQYYGDLDAMQQASDMATSLLKSKPELHKVRLLRAQIALSLHRTADAKRDVAHVRKKAPKTEGLAEAEHAIALMSGNTKAFAQTLTPGKTWRSYAVAAHGRFVTGDPLTAKRYYAIAEVKFPGTNPASFAWLDVQRGLFFLHTGDFEAAKRFYEGAVERCDDYPLALEHLAEIEHLLGNDARAIELYQQVIKQTQNPEFMGALADVYAGQGNKAEAAKLVELARTRNAELLKQFPEAMYWHAADFYLGVGDAKTARTLLTKNAKNRPALDQLQPLAEAQLAAGDPKAAKRTIKRVLASKLDTAEIHWTAARIAGATGDAATREKHATRALALNPKIAILEGPIVSNAK